MVQWLNDYDSVNHMGSASAIEAEGILRIWQISMDLLGMWYRTVISDGDAKIVSLLNTKKPYRDMQMIKHECVGHCPEVVLETPRTY